MKASPMPAGALPWLVAVLASAAAAVPGALRAERSALVGLGLAASLAVALGPALFSIAHARDRGLSTGARAVLLGVGLSSLPLALFAARLQTGTNHRPLGAVTFAIAGALVVVVATLIAARTLQWSAEQAPRRWPLRVLVGLSFAGPALLALRVLMSPEVRTSALDIALGLGSAALLGSVRWPSGVRGLPPLAGLSVWLLLVGSGTLALSGPTAVEARAASPALHAVVGWLPLGP